MNRYSILLGLAVLAGCGSEFCNLLGCTSGLTISFTSPPTSAFHLSATVDGIGTFDYDCPEIAHCNTSPTLAGFTPGHAVVTVTYQGRSASTEVNPIYHTAYPNGKDCGGGCTEGTVSLALP